MRDYTIAIDASVDIEQHYIDENGIVIIPMKYILDEKEYIMQNRLTEEATGKQVIALPIEATAIGNLQIQMRAAESSPD